MVSARAAGEYTLDGSQCCSRHRAALRPRCRRYHTQCIQSRRLLLGLAWMRPAEVHRVALLALPTALSVGWSHHLYYTQRFYTDRQSEQTVAGQPRRGLGRRVTSDADSSVPAVF